MIYVITHKAFHDDFIPSNGYRILHVGTNQNTKSNYFRDDTENNISSKNPYYCELTGLYWIWKNGKENPDEIVGLVHYRRFFTTKKSDLKYAYFGTIPEPLNMEQINSIITDSGTVILPEKSKGIYSLETAYAFNHNIEDLRILRKVIEEYSPEYLKNFDHVFREKDFFGYNMIICKKRVLDQYCEWLFPLMEIVETKINTDKKMDAYQRRVFGFLSERLLQIWINHNSYIIKTFPVFNTEKRTDIMPVKVLKRIKSYKLMLQRVFGDDILNNQNKRFHI